MASKFYFDVFKALLILGVVLGVAKLSGGLATILVTIAGVLFALRNKVGYLASCYALYPVLVNFNRAIVTLDSLLAISARGGNFLLMVLMLFMGGRKGVERIPLGWLFIYCIVAAISSIDGWMPIVSICFVYYGIANYHTIIANVR